jgi:hypothetical protein
MTRSGRWWLLSLLALSAFVPLSVTASSVTAGATTACHAPRMTGLTVSAARSRARTAGCRLRFDGARVQTPTIQTIRRQSVPPGRVATAVTLDVNPLCGGAINPGAPPGEPIIKSGTPELITGLFVAGGAYIERSAPDCKNIVGTSSAGTITVTNSVGSVIADNVAVSAGALLSVNVSPGAYTVSGVFSGGNKVGPIQVTVGADQIVRQDLVLDVP